MHMCVYVCVETILYIFQIINLVVGFFVEIPGQKNYTILNYINITWQVPLATSLEKNCAFIIDRKKKII
jgi:hypothetical protein